MQKYRQKVFDDTKRTETIGQIDKLSDKKKQTEMDRKKYSNTNTQTDKKTDTYKQTQMDIRLIGHKTHMDI